MQDYKTNFLIIILFISSIYIGNAQTIFSEDFEAVTHPDLPINWTTTTLGTDAGFYTGNSDSAIVGSFWIVGDHTTFAMSNDDACGCDKSDDYLILPEIDLSSYTESTVFLQFDATMEDFWLGIGMVKIDTGNGWIDIYTMEPSPDWQTRVVNLTPFVGAANVLIAFHYNDEGDSGLGLAIDNVSVFVPSNQFDVAMYSVENIYDDYVKIPISQLLPIAHSSTIFNNGSDTLHDVKIIAQSAQTGYKDTAIVGSLAPAQYASSSFDEDFSTSLGNSMLSYSIIHSNTDDNTSNNAINYIFSVSDSIMSKGTGTIQDAQIPMEDEVIAQVFNVFKTDSITSISIHLLMADIDDGVQFFIYEMLGGFPDVIIDSTEIFSSLTTGWTTHYLSNAIQLTPGDYAIGMKKIGAGITGLTATTDYYTPNTTYTSRFYMVDYFWYWDEQAYPGTTADHHTYFMRANFGGEISTGINKIDSEQNDIAIYPNPSNGMINISSRNEIEQLMVYDMNGRLVYETTNMFNPQLDFTNMEKGMYFCKIKQSNKWSSEKLIIK